MVIRQFFPAFLQYFLPFTFHHSGRHVLTGPRFIQPLGSTLGDFRDRFNPALNYGVVNASVLPSKLERFLNISSQPQWHTISFVGLFLELRSGPRHKSGCCGALQEAWSQIAHGQSQQDVALVCAKKWIHHGSSSVRVSSFILCLCPGPSFCSRSCSQSKQSPQLQAPPSTQSATSEPAPCAEEEQKWWVRLNVSLYFRFFWLMLGKHTFSQTACAQIHIIYEPHRASPLWTRLVLSASLKKA